MSHVVEITTKITDLTALQLAIAELGWNFMQDQKTYAWYGHYMGDAPMPQGMTAADLGKCDHAVKIPGCKYEVGLRQQQDGSYRIVYDYWERSMNNALGEKAGPLVQAYAKHKTMHEVARMGHRVVGEQKLADGSVKLVVQQGGAW